MVELELDNLPTFHPYKQIWLVGGVGGYVLSTNF